MSEKDFINLFGDAISRNPSTIKMEDEFKMYDEWCSIAYISTIAMMYDNFDVQLDESYLRSLKTVRDLYNTIK